MTATTSDSPQPSLRDAILKAGTVRFASGAFIQKRYSDGTADPIEHKVQEIVEIGIDDLMELFTGLLASAKLEEKPAAPLDDTDDEQFYTELGYNQGAAAQYAAILVALTGREES